MYLTLATKEVLKVAIATYYGYTHILVAMVTHIW